ncbi:calcium-binding protein [Streptomyces sp. NBC_00059]|uniref:calcium-binding protein n=1 Tax=Streptomyces sp. NBC_00059 TaxID=2975635 RepID=UPI002251CAAF|nr:calcium-binding protein [Streptomyces sp. NBC_00059]MCX5410938.1 calcium-binding protein [Streptomyces sp. NBC_00059]
MRIRATVAAVSGALALSALAVPAAQAGDQAVPNLDKPTAAEVFGTGAKAPRMSSRAVDTAPVISKVVVNGGKDIVVGTTAAKKITVSVTASHPSGIADGYVDLWHGTDVETDVDGWVMPNEDAATCTNSSATTATCKMTITILPGYDLYKNALAGTWKVTAGALSGDETQIAWNDYQSTARVQRLSKVTVNAAPEPVKKGKTITVTGKLSRANWETGTYKGYATQAVKLQFRKKTSSTYTTVKTIKSSSTGALKTTVKASVDGYWRYSFAGTSTTPTVTAAGDFVDVK